jgi:hypothetical protein
MAATSKAPRKAKETMQPAAETTGWLRHMFVLSFY